MITIVENSNICDVTEGIILQGVNCQGVMGSGVAKQLRDKYPDIFTNYKKLCNAVADNSPEYLLGHVDYFYPITGLVIANCFTQLHYGKSGKKYASYDALEEAFTHIASINDTDRQPVHIPYLIGAGLGGLKESIVLAMIEEMLAGQRVYLHKFNK